MATYGGSSPADSVGPPARLPSGYLSPPVSSTAAVMAGLPIPDELRRQPRRTVRRLKVRDAAGNEVELEDHSLSLAEIKAEVREELDWLRSGEPSGGRHQADADQTVQFDRIIGEGP